MEFGEVMYEADEDSDVIWIGTPPLPVCRKHNSAATPPGKIVIVHGCYGCQDATEEMRKLVKRIGLHQPR